MDYFKLKENKTDFSTEVFAGLTTFMTMAYILAVNPGIMAAAKMDPGAVFTTTAICAFIGTITMALYANYPFALAPGMGLNAYFAYTVAAQYGWQLALLAVFTEGLIFVAMSFFDIREKIFQSIPQNMKYAVSVGIGLFICFIGLQNGGLIVSSPATFVTLGSIQNIPVALFLIGMIITVSLCIYKVRGALFFGILGTYCVGAICQVAGIYVPNPDQGLYSLIPAAIVSMPPSFSSISLFAAMDHIDFSVLRLFDFLAIVFAFLFVDVFDTIGTLIGVSDKAGFLDKEGKLPRLKKALLSDAVATTAGAVLGSSTVTAYVESAAGVTEGGRTGMASVVTAFCFLLALFFWPLFSVIPAFATAPALVMVGLFMMESVVKINFKDFDEAVPAFLTIVMMPFAYSIAEGLVFGVLSYVIFKMISNKYREVSIVMYIIALLFFIRLVA